MNKERSIYRFSPIKDMQSALQVVEYIATEATKMIFRNQGYTLPIRFVTIFAHYQDEYEKLVQLVSKLGTQRETDSGVEITLESPIKVFAMKLDVNGELKEIHHLIESISIRKPDPYRMQVGCCEFEYHGDYIHIASTETLFSHTLRRIEHDDSDMVEFFDPHFDVLAYIVRS